MCLNQSGKISIIFFNNQVQTLLRGEIYWLLANQETAQKFEESMLDHLRQISFHDSPGAMATFLKV